MAVTGQNNKKWKVDISDGYDAVTGQQKRHRKTDFKSRKEDDELRGNKQGTIDSQESYYRVYVSDYFKDADMHAVSITDIKEYRNCLKSQPRVKGGTLTNSHVNQQMNYIHSAFVAVERETAQATN